MLRSARIGHRKTGFLDVSSWATVLEGLPFGLKRNPIQHRNLPKTLGWGEANAQREAPNPGKTD